VDAVDRADLDAGVVLLSDAGFCDDVSQGCVSFVSRSDRVAVAGAAIVEVTTFELPRRGAPDG
jgi:hypothetical protein